MTKGKGFINKDDIEEDKGRGALRARNRTVMLTPDVTGEVRARLAQENVGGFGMGGGLKSGFLTATQDLQGNFPIEQVETNEVTENTNYQESIEASDYSENIVNDNQYELPIEEQIVEEAPAEEPNCYEEIVSEEPEVQEEILESQELASQITITHKPAYVMSSEVTDDSQENITRKRTGTVTLKANSIEEDNMNINNSTDRINWVKKSAIMGFLVSYDSNPDGDVFNLYAGRLVVTSEVPNSGNYLLLSGESVSPMHAILRLAPSGELQVLDQLSENGTRIKHFGSDSWEELSGDKGTLEHGDIIVFGERKFHVCLVAKEQ
jgi:hypothetical protein